MSTRSLNKVELIGNLTRDPELRYTPQGTAVCSFGMATNRSWVTESGDRKEDVEFHRVVAWAKLAELCAQLLFKGRKVYVQGRLQTRQWEGQDGVKRSTTEVVIDDMIVLDSRRQDGEEYAEGADYGAADYGADQNYGYDDRMNNTDSSEEPEASTKKTATKKKSEVSGESGEDIPF